MKRLALEIDDDVYAELRDFVAMSKMCGSDFGPLWEFGCLVCRTIEQDKESLKIVKAEPQRKKKTGRKT